MFTLIFFIYFISLFSLFFQFPSFLKSRFFHNTILLFPIHTGIPVLLNKEFFLEPRVFKGSVNRRSLVKLFHKNSLEEVICGLRQVCFVNDVFYLALWHINECSRFTIRLFIIFERQLERQHIEDYHAKSPDVRFGVVWLT